MQRFARWHIWLGWLVGVPILMWTISGLAMVARPIEEVRGDHLRTKVEQGADPATLAMPQVGEPIRSAELQWQPNGPVWMVVTAKGANFRYSAKNGALLPPIIEDEARAIAEQTYAGKAELAALTYFPADEVPLDLRVPRASWQAHYADGTNVYIDDTTGEVLALRTSWWRFYDFMWGLHIMDLQTRENSHHPILIVFAVLAVIGSLLGCALMFRRRKARVRARP